MKFKVNDKVIVNTGNDKGKEGIILEIDKAKNKVIVQGLNLVKKHQKSNGEDLGGVIETEAFFDISNISLIDPKTNKPTRVKYETIDGKKVRVAVKSGNQI